jgi:hypothetical protein
MDVNVTSLQERAKVEAKSYLEQLLSEGARKLLQAAIENEVAEYLQSQSGRRSESGERSVVRNGHLPERDLVPFEHGELPDSRLPLVLPGQSRDSFQRVG